MSATCFSFWPPEPIPWLRPLDPTVGLPSTRPLGYTLPRHVLELTARMVFLSYHPRWGVLMSWVLSVSVSVCLSVCPFPSLTFVWRWLINFIVGMQARLQNIEVKLVYQGHRSRSREQKRVHVSRLSNALTYRRNVIGTTGRHRRKRHNVRVTSASETIGLYCIVTG